MNPARRSARSRAKVASIRLADMRGGETETWREGKFFGGDRERDPRKERGGGFFLVHEKHTEIHERGIRERRGRCENRERFSCDPRVLWIGVWMTGLRFLGKE